MIQMSTNVKKVHQNFDCFLNCNWLFHLLCLAKALVNKAVRHYSQFYTLNLVFCFFFRLSDQFKQDRRQIPNFAYSELIDVAKYRCARDR